eukprot:329530_1
MSQKVDDQMKELLKSNETILDQQLKSYKIHEEQRDNLVSLVKNLQEISTRLGPVTELIEKLQAKIDEKTEKPVAKPPTADPPKAKSPSSVANDTGNINEMIRLSAKDVQKLCEIVKEMTQRDFAILKDESAIYLLPALYSLLKDFPETEDVYPMIVLYKLASKFTGAISRPECYPAITKILQVLDTITVKDSPQFPEKGFESLKKNLRFIQTECQGSR